MSLVPESHPVYGSMPRDPSTGDIASGWNGAGLNGAALTVGQDPNPAGTGGDGAPDALGGLGVVAQGVDGTDHVRN